MLYFVTWCNYGQHCNLAYATVAYTFANHQVINQKKNLSWAMNGKAMGNSNFFPWTENL